MTPDINKDDLTNTIIQISEVRSRKPDSESQVIALTVDTQKYFAPPLKDGSKVLKEVRALFDLLDRKSANLLRTLKELGIIVD